VNPGDLEMVGNGKHQPQWVIKGQRRQGKIGVADSRSGDFNLPRVVGQEPDVDPQVQGQVDGALFPGGKGIREGRDVQSAAHVQPSGSGGLDRGFIQKRCEISWLQSAFLFYFHGSNPTPVGRSHFLKKIKTFGLFPQMMTDQGL